MGQTPAIFEKFTIRRVKEGSQSVTNCYQLKMRAEDGKMRNTHVADTETILQINISM